MLYSSLGHEGTQVITPLQVATDEANLSFRRSCSHKNKWKPSALFNGISSAVLIIQSSFQCSVYIYNLQVCVQTLPEACNRSCGYYRSWGLCPRYSLVNSCIYLNAPFVIPNANHRWVSGTRHGQYSYFLPTTVSTIRLHQRTCGIFYGKRMPDENATSLVMPLLVRGWLLSMSGSILFMTNDLFWWPFFYLQPKNVDNDKNDRYFTKRS